MQRLFVYYDVNIITTILTRERKATVRRVNRSIARNPGTFRYCAVQLTIFKIGDYKNDTVTIAD